MKQTVTIEIEDSAALRLLHELAAMNVIRIAAETSLQDAEKEAEKASQDELITARLNKIYETVDSSIESCYVMAQAEVYGKEDW
jgi:hypothetical protein